MTSDVLYVALIVIGLFLDHFALWGTFVRWSRTDPASARLWLWRAWMILLWTLAGAGIVLWLHQDRAWSALGLIVSGGWRLPAAIGLALLLAIAYARTFAKIVRLPFPKRARLQEQFGKFADALPHTRAELGWFVALSVTAGFCEEFIFRGYLIWFFQPALGLGGAAALALIAFVAAHAYQGARGVLTTGIIGSLFTLTVLIFESLWPAIVLHALVDIGQGCVGWLVFRKVQGDDNRLNQAPGA